MIDRQSDLVARRNNHIHVTQFVTPSDLTRNNKKIIKSCAGVVPLAGIATLIFPENPTGFAALMSSCESVEMTDHADSSITNVKDPPARF